MEFKHLLAIYIAQRGKLGGGGDDVTDSVWKPQVRQQEHAIRFCGSSRDRKIRTKAPPLISSVFDTKSDSG